MATEGLYGSDTAANVLRVAVAEFIGTFMLVLAGTSVAVAATLETPIAGAAADSLAVALTFGLVLVALVTSLGHISGCHLNPAVTLGLAAVGRFPLRYIGPYVVAQFVGAIAASLVVLGMYGRDARTLASLGATQPTDGVGVFGAFFTELVVTFLLVFVIIAVATDSRVPAPAAGLAVGLTLFAAIMVAGPLTGGAVNPARALGPMIVSGQLGSWYVYVLGPIAGGVLAALTYDKVLRGATEPSEAVKV